MALCQKDVWRSPDADILGMLSICMGCGWGSKGQQDVCCAHAQLLVVLLAASVLLLGSAVGCNSGDVMSAWGFMMMM